VAAGHAPGHPAEAAADVVGHFRPLADEMEALEWRRMELGWQALDRLLARVRRYDAGGRVRW
jgi:hypothetical protein